MVFPFMLGLAVSKMKDFKKHSDKQLTFIETLAVTRIFESIQYKSD